MMITDLLSTDGYIMYNKKLARCIGVNPSILLGYLCSEYNFYYNTDRLENDMFYCTREKIKYNTGLTETEQRTAIKKLKEHNILIMLLKGIPAKTYYKINEDEILKIFSSKESDKESLQQDVDIRNHEDVLLKNISPSDKESLQQDIRNPNTNNNIYNKPIKKNLNNNISKPLKNSQSNFSKIVERTCLENDITDDKSIELIEQFLGEMKIKTKGAIEANIAKIASKPYSIISKCINTSYERNYRYITPPDWLNSGYGSKMVSYHNSARNPETPVFSSDAEKQAYIDSLPYL